MSMGGRSSPQFNGTCRFNQASLVESMYNLYKTWADVGGRLGRSCVFSILYLGSKVVANVAHLSDLVLNHCNTKKGAIKRLGVIHNAQVNMELDFSSGSYHIPITVLYTQLANITQQSW